MDSMYPAGVDDDEEIDEEDRCEVREGEDRCPAPATMSVFEPYTPASFEVRCCEECGKGLIRSGYMKERR